MSLQALVQYNDSTDVTATNLRLAWLTSADAGFYLVYNETRDDDVGMFREKERVDPEVFSYLRRFLIHSRWEARPPSDEPALRKREHL